MTLKMRRLAVIDARCVDADGLDTPLLDEPTSSVDSPNELQIHKNIFEAFSDRCIVSSIHRLHLLPLFDYVYVMEKGRIIQQGAPQELMHTDGALKTMVERSTDSECL